MTRMLRILKLRYGKNGEKDTVEDVCEGPLGRTEAGKFDAGTQRLMETVLTWLEERESDDTVDVVIRTYVDDGV